MTQPLVTQRDYEALVRRLLALEKRIGRIEVLERLLTVPATSYTPTYSGATTTGVTTYTTQTGSYIQLGPLTLVWGQVIWTTATGTGNAQISIPITPTVQSTLGNVRSNLVTFAAGAPEILTVGAFVQFRSPASNLATTPVAVEAAGDFFFAIAFV